jgi:hypothetical protein
MTTRGILKIFASLPRTNPPSSCQTNKFRAFAKKNFRKKNASAAGRGQGMSEAAVVSYSPSEMTPLHGLCRRILFGKDFWQMLYPISYA